MLFVQDLISVTFKELNFIIDIGGYIIEIINIDRYPKFLVAQNCIKKGFSSTVLVIDTFHMKYCSVLT